MQVVAGQHAQAAGVDAERLVEPVLGAEVGDRAGRARRHAGAGTNGRRRWRWQASKRPAGSSRTRPAGRCRRARATSRACRCRTGMGVAVARAQPPASMRLKSDRDLWMPGPVEVVREPPQPFQLLGQARRRGGHRGDIDGLHARRMLHGRRSVCGRPRTSGSPRDGLSGARAPRRHPGRRCGRRSIRRRHTSPRCPSLRIRGRPSPTAAASVRNR